MALEQGHHGGEPIQHFLLGRGLDDIEDAEKPKSDTPVRTAIEGYTVVVNDTRGQHASDGVFDPFRTDVDDGYDVVYTIRIGQAHANFLKRATAALFYRLLNRIQ